MPVKIKRSQKRLIALTITERAKPKFFRILKKFIKSEIIKAIESGRSPVNKGGTDPSGTSGKLRFEKYSDSYSDQLGRGKLKSKGKRPVNLTVSGKMLRSLKSRITKNSINLWFSNPIAKYHDRLGAGKKGVLRRMLPHDGEEFNAGIRKRIANALIKAIQLSKK